jgi:hypothetical protein
LAGGVASVIAGFLASFTMIGLVLVVVGSLVAITTGGLMFVGTQTTVRRLQTAFGIATTLAGVSMIPTLTVEYAGLNDSAVSLPDAVGIPLVLAVTALPAILGGLLAMALVRRPWPSLALLLIPLNATSLLAAAVLLLGLGPLPLLPALLLLAATILVGIGMEQQRWQSSA